MRGLIDVQHFLVSELVENLSPKFLYKRATDLIAPTIDLESLIEFSIGDHDHTFDLKWIMADLEGGMRTGCVKAGNQRTKSRSAMLVYRGRIVGCMYSSTGVPDTRPTEESLQSMFADLAVPDTSVTMYDLPDNVTLAISALFRGYPVQRSDSYDAVAYFDYIYAWLGSQESTACVIITAPSNSSTCLAYVYKGQFCGAFCVEQQQFKTDKNFVHELLRMDPSAHVEVTVLPRE